MSENQNLGHYTKPAQPRTIKEIHAHGDVKTRIGILIFIGIATCLLIIGGFLVFFIRPEIAKDVWVIIGPIISASITGTISYLLGERSKDRE